MATEFTPIFLLILLAIFGIAAGMVGLSYILSARRPTPVKQMPYESGMDPIGDARQRFDVRYYLVAIAFLLFDVELLFLYPWAVAQWRTEVPTADPRIVAAAEAARGDADPAVAPVTEAPAPAFANIAPLAQDLESAPAAPVDPLDPGPLAAALQGPVGIPPHFRNFAFGGVLVFLGIIVAGFAYDWRKGVFEWR